jgi:hypothetical protein
MSGWSGERRLGSRLLIGAALVAAVVSLGAVSAGSAGATDALADAAGAVAPADAGSPGHSPVPVFSAGYGVSCPDASWCMAAGGYNADGVVHVLTEFWDGSAWSVLPSPDPQGARSSQLNAISCTSAAGCVAVGSYSDARQGAFPFAEMWNGSSWTVLDVGTPAGGTDAGLSGVSCAAASSCVAVGSYANRRSVFVPLTESWDGTAWSVHRSPHASGARVSALNAVSCAGGSACMATGSYVDAGFRTVPLTERWDGSAWSVVDAPSPDGAQGSRLAGVSCPTATRCMAVGAYFNADFVREALAEVWDGARWSVVDSPTPSGSPDTALYGVSCAGASQCLAVGHSYSGSFAGKDDTLAESWNGTSWAIVASPSPSTSSGLSGVSCPSTTRCFALGAFFNSSNDYQTLAESWDGSAMTIVDQDAELAGISCSAVAHCVAVGTYISPASVSVTLAEVRTGRHWRAVPTPNPADSEGSYLAGVDCPRARLCVAVGYYYNLDNTRLTLVETWDGKRWSIVPSPSVDGAAYSVLYGVTCTSPSDCMAVGSADAHALAESWNGAGWSIVPTSDTSNSAYTELNDVACMVASRCLAVGYETDTYYGADLTIAEEWDGTTWSIVPSAQPGKNRARASVLHGISCSAAGGCLAVGFHQHRSGTYATLAERWTGSSWVRQASANPAGTPYSELSAISCVGSGRCFAVGNYFDRSGDFVPLGETWTGSTWRIDAGPGSASGPWRISYLQGVACGVAPACTAVGTSGSPANLETLVQVWKGAV